MSLCFSVVSLPLALLIGFWSDFHNRKTLLVYTTLTGGISMIIFGMSTSYPILLVSRTISGGCAGGSVAICFSLLSDFYPSAERAQASALLSCATGGGALVGQLFAGYTMTALGWQTPHIIWGSLTIALAGIITNLLHEPIRGALDTTSTTTVPTLVPKSAAATLLTLLTPSIFLMLLQSLPNNLPLGVFSVQMQDFLVSDIDMSIDAATTLIALFGLGATIGGVGGGVMGNHLYQRNKVYLPITMGISCILAGVVMQLALMVLYHKSFVYATVGALIMLSGVLAAFNGANGRAILLNVTAPQSRGSVISINNIINNIGRGIGATAAGTIMQVADLSRKDLLYYMMYLWVLAGALLWMIAGTIVKDENNMKLELQKRVVVEEELKLLTDLES